MTYAYDDYQLERFVFPQGNAFGATAASRTYQGPPGRKGLVREIMATITAAMVGTTSVPEIRVGIAAGSNEFARFLLGTTAIAGYGTGVFRARSLCNAAQGRTGGVPVALNDFANHIFLEGNNNAGTVNATYAGTATTFTYIPADTAFFISGVAGVGGTPAGTADVLVDIQWL